jgi:hypothetical protein
MFLDQIKLLIVEPNSRSKFFAVERYVTILRSATSPNNGYLQLLLCANRNFVLPLMFLTCRKYAGRQDATDK